MANYHSARIPVELLNEVFGHTKSYPEKLLVPEVQKCEFNVLSDGSAEIFFDVVTDVTVPIHLHITEEQALDCVAHSGVFDVSRGMVEVDGPLGGRLAAEISEDYVRQVLWEHSRELVLSYLCLFRVGGQAN